ncbi:hypothetical protein [Streptomyces niveus]|uniref:hypothetical protein n=1 Tax=Streptomyces niveus TaxID=193462 RepID=UPI0003C58DD2|nr:hypothetical protein [Streptomyces niveus]EST26200.1 hypothetical protein M877_19875 [Streptomyces niveus NCIMB 11891]
MRPFRLCGPPWVAGPAGALFAGAAGLLSTDPTGTRLRHYVKNAWHDIGPAGTLAVTVPRAGP